MSERDPGAPTDKPFAQGCGWMLLFFVAQTMAGSIVFTVVTKALQAAVPAWRNDAPIAFVIAAIPALLVVWLLERWCWRVAGNGPITMIIALVLAAGSIS